MPTYTFLCKGCKREFTVLRSMKDYDNPALCVCGKLSRERIMSLPSLKVSGSSAPTSYAQKLAGKRVNVPNVPNVKGATSVLGHACHAGCQH